MFWECAGQQSSVYYLIKNADFPDSKNAFKARISLKAALGDQAVSQTM